MSTIIGLVSTFRLPLQYYQFIGLFSTINIDTHRFYPISLLNMRLLIGIMI